MGCVSNTVFVNEGRLLLTQTQWRLTTCGLYLAENNMAAHMYALNASSGTLGDVNLHPCVMPGGRCRLPPVKEVVRGRKRS